MARNWTQAEKMEHSENMKKYWKKKALLQKQVDKGDIESLFEQAGRKWHYCPNCGFELRGQNETA